MEIGYSDFVKLCRVNDPEEWVGWLSIRADGAYVKTPPDGLDHNERAALSAHPTGNLAEPALKFPCTLRQFQIFLDEQGVYGCIDAFDMADWVADQLARTSGVEKTKVPASAEKPISTTERKTLLTIIGIVVEKGYGRDLSKPYECATEIQKDADTKGIKISDDTIAAKLKEAAVIVKDKAQ